MLKNKIKFNLPSSFNKKENFTIIPIFLPYLGCEYRCVFCAQEVQTGRGIINERSLDDSLKNQYKFHGKEKNIELAFFGGTFTALKAEIQSKCIDFANEKIKNGEIKRLRCSTRPDAIDACILNKLSANNFHLIELGIQSFNDTALKESNRGYCNKIAMQACEEIKNSKLKLGIQLMPSMPGLSVENFLKDVEIALSFNPACLRIYPCQVIKGTVLAKKWLNKEFKPWDLQTTIYALTQALKMAWEKEVPVIRMGLAPEAELLDSILEGAWHPALGNLVQANALYEMVKNKIELNAFTKILSAELPSSCQGFIAGHSGELRQKWFELGLEFKNIKWIRESVTCSFVCE